MRKKGNKESDLSNSILIYFFYFCTSDIIDKHFFKLISRYDNEEFWS